MHHNLFIDSNPEADTRHRVSGLPLTFSRKETLQ
nr:MAG TPA: exoenyzme S [Caudoviricetes sp.]